MCNLSQGIAERSEARGRKEGMETHARATAEKLYEKKMMSVEDIAEVVDYDVNLVRSWLGLTPAN